MRLFDASSAAALLSCMAGSAIAQSAAARGEAPPSLTPPSPDEIVVTGRRDSEKYRLLPQFRPVREDPADRSRRNLARNWSFHNVGPRGCPMQLNRLISFGADGSVHFGDPAAGK